MSHKKRDWSKYNKSLVNRGSLTFWIAPEIVKSWETVTEEKRRGRPFIYSDTAIETAAVIRYVFGLTLRSCEGFLSSLFELLSLDLSVPSYTARNPKIGFWRRQLATDFEPVCIAQLIQVELLRRRLRLAQTQGASLPNSQFLNHERYTRKSPRG